MRISKILTMPFHFLDMSFKAQTAPQAHSFIRPDPGRQDPGARDPGARELGVREQESEILNAAAIAGMLAVMPAEQVRELIDILVGEIESRAASMGRAGAAGDCRTIAQEARDLRAACDSFGLAELAERARRIETVARADDAAAALALAAEIGPCVSRALDALLRTGAIGR